MADQRKLAFRSSTARITLFSSDSSIHTGSGAPSCTIAKPLSGCKKQINDSGCAKECSDREKHNNTIGAIFVIVVNL